MPITYLPPRRGIRQSEAYAEAVSYGVAGDPPLLTVAIHGADIVDPVTGEPVALYLVNDFQPLVATLEADAPLDAGQPVTFTPMQMRVVLPSESDTQRVPEATIEFAGVSRHITPYLRAAAQARSTITIIGRTYLPSDLSGPHELPPLRLSVRAASVDAQLVRVTAGYGDVVNVPFPQVLYSLADFPALGVVG
jgi:hypothetical protein